MRKASLAVFLLALTGCVKKQPAAAYRTIVIPPAENLSGDPELDWVRPVVPALVSAQLENQPAIAVRRILRYPDAAAFPPHQILYCRYEKSGADRLTVRCWLDNQESTISAAGPIATVSSWISSIGRSIDSTAPEAPAASTKALMGFARRRFEEAIKDAPDFGPAYEDGITSAVLANDGARARVLITAAQERGERLSPLTRARVELSRASLTGDRPGELAALVAIDKLQPPDEARLRAMAQLLLALRRTDEAAAVQTRLTELHPDSPDDWNQLGYLRAWSGDFAGAVKALEHYRAIAPEPANAFDSLGEVHYYFGRFADAEKLFLESHKAAPQFNGGQALYKAAMARWNQGDGAGAAKLFEQFAAARPPERAFLDAEWLYITGKAAEAGAAMTAFAGQSKGDAAARAWSQLAFWKCVSRDWTAARSDLGKAIAAQPSNVARVPIAMVAFITGPEADTAGWQARAAQMFPGEATAVIRDSALVMALVLRGRSADALPVARELRERRLAAADRFGRLILARCLRDTGKEQEAAELLKSYPIPPVPTATPFESWLTLVERELRAAR